MKEMASGEALAQNVQDYPEASEEFMMYSFKVLPCCKGYRHNWKRCPFAHEGESERRRDPRTYKYMAVVCPATKKGVQCPRGDKCAWAHNVFEYWLHPLRFRTEMCSKKDSCKRRFCFFAHQQSELRACNVKKAEAAANKKTREGSPAISDSPVASTMLSLPLAKEPSAFAQQYDLDILGSASRLPDSGSMWGLSGGVNIAPSKGNAFASGMSSTFPRNEIHDSMASIPSMGWDKLASLCSPRQDMPNNAPSSQVPDIYIPPPPPPAPAGLDRFSPRQQLPDNMAFPGGATRLSPRLSPRHQFHMPEIGSRPTPRQVLEEEIALGLFSPRMSFPVQPAPPRPGVNRFSPRGSLQEKLGSPPPPAGWCDPLGGFAMQSRDSMLAGAMSCEGWSMNPPDVLEPRQGQCMTPSETDAAGLLQSIQILKNLDLGACQTGEEHGLVGCPMNSRETTLRDHLSFFTNP